MMQSKEKNSDVDQDSFTLSVIDITYGQLIKHADEGLKKVKNKSEEAPYTISRYTDWLQKELKRLEEEKKRGYYNNKLKCQSKIIDIEKALKYLHFEYCREREKINMSM